MIDFYIALATLYFLFGIVAFVLFIREIENDSLRKKPKRERIVIRLFSIVMWPFFVLLALVAIIYAALERLWKMLTE